MSAAGVLVLLIFASIVMSNLAKATGKLISVDYEVFGRVQGVCFRMYTEGEARKLGVVGWVKNSRQGTVVGQVQGPEEKVNSMAWKYLLGEKAFPLVLFCFLPNFCSGGATRKAWLSKVGSPSSRINRTDFNDEKEIPKLQYNGFNTRY
ncbi:acylphosphatase-2 isoform X1 [Xenopus laevis]|uniref:Acylphosphatase n=1 Tax=Xenopus laevis TaxID=8355 RepID=A0A8J1KM33_XENLA|nr:acylphosphatase-2 isoform X1 [Xenopus laevis]